MVLSRALQWCPQLCKLQLGKDKSFAGVLCPWICCLLVWVLDTADVLWSFSFTSQSNQENIVVFLNYFFFLVFHKLRTAKNAVSHYWAHWLLQAEKPHLTVASSRMEKGMALCHIMKFDHPQVILHLAQLYPLAGKMSYTTKENAAKIFSKYTTDCKPRKSRTLDSKNIRKYPFFRVHGLSKDICLFPLTPTCVYI